MTKIDILLTQIRGELQVLEADEATAFVGGGTDNNQPTKDKSPTLPEKGTMYGVFDRSDSKLTMYWDAGTPNDRSDDVAMFSGKAHNNVIRSSNGPWPNGEYTMRDQTGGYMHPNESWRDTPSDSYG